MGLLIRLIYIVEFTYILLIILLSTIKFGYSSCSGHVRTIFLKIKKIKKDKVAHRSI